MPGFNIKDGLILTVPVIIASKFVASKIPAVGKIPGKSGGFNMAAQKSWPP